MKRVWLLIFLAFFATFFAPGLWCAERDTLVVYLGTQPLTPLNPAYSTTRQSIVLYHNWGDTLLCRDTIQTGLVPCLARSWQWIDSHTLEFRLRKGVRFHNGEPFTAEAVRFSMELLKGPDSLVSRYLAPFERVEAVDDYTVRIRTSRPYPTAPEVIANVLFIYPPVYYQKVGRDGFDGHPIGTGPYQFISATGSSEVLFRANPDYFGGPKGKPRIPHLRAVKAPEELILTEALITSKAHLVWGTRFDHEQLPIFQQNPGFKIKTVPILRVSFLCMDADDRSGVGFFKDKRVRMAVNHAIDKDRIIRDVYNGYAERIDSVTSPLHFGHEPDVTSYPYDPARARTLLAEAGYPNGFTVDFFATVSESTAEAIVRDLEAVGIRIRLHWLGGNWDLFYRRFLQGEIPLALMTWGSYSIFDAAAILDPFFVASAPGCYGTTTQIGALIQDAGNTIEAEIRRKCYSKAQKMIAAEAFWVPLCANHAISIMKSDLDFDPSYDEIDRYFAASWD